MPKRILFLAATMQPFLASGIQSLLRQNKDVEVILYCKNFTEFRFFDFVPDERFTIYTYDYEPETFFWPTIKDYNPDVVFCAGWMYTRYLNWVTTFKTNGAKTICAMDTQWQGSLKQKLFVLAAPFIILKAFTHAWIPGGRQEEYALRLGFKMEQLLHHLYAPDTKLFAESFTQFLKNNSSIFPKTFLYVGRFEEHKLGNFLRAFNQLSIAQLQGWKLHLVGEGSMDLSMFTSNSSITISKYLPQNKLASVAASSAVFCLCSSDEPWGTAVQEFASAGMPLLVSKQCGSGDSFLRNNGILVDGNSLESIQHGIRSFIKLNDDQLFSMAAESHSLGITTNSDTWANELLELF